MRRARLGLLLGAAWLIALILSVLIAQQPLGPAVLLAIGRTVLDLVAVAVVVAVGGGIGVMVGPDLPRLSSLERHAMRLLVGLGVISIVVLVLGLLGLFPPPSLWIITLALSAAAPSSVEVAPRNKARIVPASD
jgi:hypothetical protein